MMARAKIIATLSRFLMDEDGNMEVVFKIDKSCWNYKNAIKALEKIAYALEISKPRSKRSLEQNALLWAVISEIAEKQDGHLADDWDVYCALLEKANAKYTDIIAPVEAEEDMRKIKGLRGVRIMRSLEQDGREFYVYRLYPGSSTFNVKEMSQLIDVALDYAVQLGIDITYYNDQR